MVLDRLLVVWEGIDALLIRVPLYKHATEEFSDLLSRYAVDKTSKQTAEAVEQSASTFPPHLTRPHTLLLVRRLKIWCAARRSILGASTVGSFHAVDSGSALRSHLSSRSCHRPCAVHHRKHNAAAMRASARRMTRKKSSANANRVSNSARHKSRQMTTVAMSRMPRRW